MLQEETDDPDQKQFIELLPRLRNGDATIADWQFLSKRYPNSANSERFKNAVRLEAIRQKTLVQYKYLLDKIKQE